MVSEVALMYMTVIQIRGSVKDNSLSKWPWNGDRDKVKRFFVCFFVFYIIQASGEKSLFIVANSHHKWADLYQKLIRNASAKCVGALPV